MSDLDPRHYIWAAEEDDQYWAYCYCAWTSPRFPTHAEAMKVGGYHIGDAKFRFIEEGVSLHFDVVSELIGRGIDPPQVSSESEPETGETWTVAGRDDDSTFVTISYERSHPGLLWHAADADTGIRFISGTLETVVSAAAGVVRRAEALQNVKP